MAPLWCHYNELMPQNIFPLYLYILLCYEQFLCYYYVNIHSLMPHTFVTLLFLFSNCNFEFCSYFVQVRILCHVKHLITFQIKSCIKLESCIHNCLNCSTSVVISSCTLQFILYISELYVYTHLFNSHKGNSKLLTLRHQLLPG